MNKKAGATNAFMLFQLFFCALLGLSLYIFSIGLPGPFILDDIFNLKVLSPFQETAHYSYKDFFSDLSESGKFKRFISFFSFALQHSAWPDHPEQFKLANIIIHYLNAILVTIFSYLMAKQFFFPEQTKKLWLIFALSTAFIWLIHPIQQSSVFYVVQRMTELSSFFMLLGLVCYLLLRPRLNFNYFSHTIFFCIIMGVLLSLATFSKGNGLLLVVYLFLIEHLYQRQNKNSITSEKNKYFLFFQSVIIFLPMLLFVAYIIMQWDILIEQGTLRGFTPIERLLTQSRVIVDYIHYIIYPDVFNGGLFHDNIKISRGLLSPASTLFSLCFLISLGILAWFMRIKHIVVTVGIVWFFLSHSMESTFIPLEMYFEHRNYLAIIGAIWIFLYLMFKTWQFSPKIAASITMSYLLLVVLFAFQGAKIWSSNVNITIHWAMPKTESPRAQNYAAYYWLEVGHADKGLEYFRRSHQTLPNHLGLRVSELVYSCKAGIDTGYISDILRADIHHTELHLALPDFLTEVVKEYEAKQCMNLTAETLSQIILNISSHPDSGSQLKLYLHKLLGDVQAAQIRQLLHSPPNSS